jgi:colicin import membrane protein
MAIVNPATLSSVPYRIPPEPSRLPSILLAVVMHAVLLAFLAAGISWQNNTPVSVEAEVWDMKTESAAAPPPPTVAPEPKPEPKPEPIPKPEPPRPVKVEEPPPAPKVDIALERLKQKELKQKQLAEEKREREQEEKEKKQELAKKEVLKKKEQEKKLLAEEKAKELAEKKAKEKAEKARLAAEDAKLAKVRDAEMKRILGAAGTSGTAQKASAPKIDAGYLASITSKIKSSTSYLGSTDVSGNPRAQFKVEQLPTGEIISVRMVKSSGLAAFDDAVEKGIMKSSPLPKKKDGTVERTLDIGFSMKDLN